VSATVLAFVWLAEGGPPPPSQAARRRAVNEVVARVASRLGNTPAVARSSYIDPRVLDHYASGEAFETVGTVRAAGETTPDVLTASVELAVLGLLDPDGALSAAPARSSA
jgi:DNA topoisomerase IB